MNGLPPNSESDDIKSRVQKIAQEIEQRAETLVDEISGKHWRARGTHIIGALLAGISIVYLLQLGNASRLHVFPSYTFYDSRA